MTLSLSRSETLPFAFAAIGVSYFAVTALRKPDSHDRAALDLWERHLRDAKFAAVAGVAAGGLLWWMDRSMR